MRIYIAGNIHDDCFDLITEPVNRLDSYFYLKQDDLVKHKSSGKWKHFFLDSGAYSALNKGIEINLNEYMQFIDDNYEYIDLFAGLDAIGDHVQTEKNCGIMYAKGFGALYTFHYGEPLEALKSAVEKYDYIAIGGMVPISKEQLLPWLDEIWSLMVNDDGSAKLKVHGFGLTTASLVKRYPWESIDSTAAVMSGAMGKVFYKGKTLDFSEKENKFYHELEQDLLNEYLSNIYGGFCIEDLKGKESYKQRIAINVYYYQQFEKQLTKNPPTFQMEQGSFF